MARDPHLLHANTLSCCPTRLSTFSSSVLLLYLISWRGHVLFVSGQVSACLADILRWMADHQTQPRQNRGFHTSSQGIQLHVWILLFPTRTLWSHLQALHTTLGYTWTLTCLFPLKYVTVLYTIRRISFHTGHPGTCSVPWHLKTGLLKLASTFAADPECSSVPGFQLS